MNILNLFISGKGKSRTRIHHFAINMEKKDFFSPWAIQSFLEYYQMSTTIREQHTFGGASILRPQTELVN